MTPWRWLTSTAPPDLYAISVFVELSGTIELIPVMLDLFPSLATHTRMCTKFSSDYWQICLSPKFFLFLPFLLQQRKNLCKCAWKFGKLQFLQCPIAVLVISVNFWTIFWFIIFSTDCFYIDFLNITSPLPRSACLRNLVWLNPVLFISICCVHLASCH